MHKQHSLVYLQKLALCCKLYCISNHNLFRESSFRPRQLQQYFFITVVTVVSIPPSQRQSNTEQTINPHCSTFNSGPVKATNCYSLCYHCIAILAELLLYCEMQLPTITSFPVDVRIKHFSQHQMELACISSSHFPAKS